ncbi:MAG: transposase [Cyclobacteriaceae bacterium]|nr:transposase [Cyclobacteriaceae bacterium]
MSIEDRRDLKSNSIWFWIANPEQKGFLTNNLEFSPLTIAQIYRHRWQIETLFKRIKQNYPLRNFLGDNENAIKI